MDAKKIQKEIDQINSNTWKQRYNDPEYVLNEALQTISKSAEISYLKGAYCARLNKIACEFLMSKHTIEAVSDLYDIISFLEKEEYEEFYVNALNLTANVLQSYGDFKDALNICQKAQKAANELGDLEIIAENQSIFGLIYSDIHGYENALNSFKEALDIRITIGNKPAQASSLNLIARTHTLIGNFSEALHFYNQALNLRQEIDDKAGLRWTYIGMASTYEKMNDYQTAIVNYEKALEFNRPFDDKKCKMHCYIGIGIVKSIISPSHIAEQYLLEAKKIAEELNQKSLLYHIYKSMSEVYERLMDIPKAFAYYKHYHNLKEEVINSNIQNQLKNQEIIFAVEQSQKEAEIFRLKNVELKNAYAKLEQQNKEIKDSINYAKNIQTALLPSADYINDILPERFILYKPRDIVGGDFYWLNKIDNSILVCVADCTGHGVPGGFLSMLGISFLNEIVNKNKIYKPDIILNELRHMVISALNKNKKEVNDGMDISLVLIDKETLKCEFAGAFNPLYIVRKSTDEVQKYQLIQIDCDRMPIGVHIKDKIPFAINELQLIKDDTLYFTTDGFSDQFGGSGIEKKKFMIKRFKQLLIDIQIYSLSEQKNFLEKTLSSWMNNYEQTDDIAVVGIKF